jgi:PleD family two-component response regulator
MFVAFASDLGRQPFGRVYDDACDEGLTLVSRYNGEELVLVVNHTEVDREGDLRYWDLVPADFRPARFAVRVYND